ncbi:MAG TPA: hypothetical protein DCZ94_03890 [Lentisphaeria bacterium]|nr:MAG: hypothetical protein A2X48_05110 [Lentisphaerae bacterium GWF2_49_21]HBC86076.1 hypothetical protein [Lentisphaeria bacterium]
MIKSGVMALSLLAAAGISNAGADEVRRISLDGKEGLAAPASEMGKDGIERINKVNEPGLELFPCKDKPSKGTVLVCPGGGYFILAINHEGRDIAKMLNGFGYDVAVLLYHVNSGDKTRDMAIDEAKKALSLLQKRGTEFGLNTKRIGVMGFSAGGHLAARLANESKKGTPADFMILIYPAYLEKDGKLLDEVLPPKVPVFVYAAVDDKYSVNSNVFAAYCKDNGVKCDFTMAEKGGHGFGIKNPLPEGVKDWPEKLKKFLE